MGKTRPPARSKLANGTKRKKQMADQEKDPVPVDQLLLQATALLQTSSPEEALKPAVKALKKLRKKADPVRQLPALNLLGEINVELGEIGTAREYFSRAAEIDADGEIPDSQSGGAEKFLWLAQLSEEGGLDSVRWFEQGSEVLRNQIKALLLRPEDDEEVELLLEEKRRKLANALCSIAEVYMTDLSWDDENAEEQCDKVMEEALAVAADSPEVLQTAANVRISQLRQAEARQYLLKSLELWKNLLPEDPAIPDFPIRISLSRLLMEAEMEDEAIEVLERLVAEDDQSVETWYLGGWCLHLLAEKQKSLIDERGKDIENADPDTMNTISELLLRSRSWLQTCLELYQQIDYEDERLQEHALDLVKNLDQILGQQDPQAEAEAAEEDDWEDAQGSEDEEMEEP